MSRVMNVILTHSCSEMSPARIADVNNAISDRFEYAFTRIPASDSEFVGGDRHMECFVYLAAFNYMPLEHLLAAVKNARWDDPGTVQLFIQDEDEDRFHEVTVMSAEEAVARIRARQEERANEEYEREHGKSA